MNDIFKKKWFWAIVILAIVLFYFWRKGFFTLGDTANPVIGHRTSNANTDIVNVVTDVPTAPAPKSGGPPCCQ